MSKNITEVSGQSFEDEVLKAEGDTVESGELIGLFEAGAGAEPAAAVDQSDGEGADSSSMEKAPSVKMMRNRALCASFSLASSSFCRMS